MMPTGISYFTTIKLLMCFSPMMLAAVAGAYHGFESTPNEWRQKIENEDYLDMLGHRLWKIKNSRRPR